MPQAASTKAGLGALLTPKDSVLILIDHQPFQFANLHIHEPTMVSRTRLWIVHADLRRSAPLPGRHERSVDWGRAEPTCERNDVRVRGR